MSPLAVTMLENNTDKVGIIGLPIPYHIFRLFSDLELLVTFVVVRKTGGCAYTDLFVQITE